MNAVLKVTDTFAEVKIGASVRKIPVAWCGDMPSFIENPSVGVLLGKSGSKIWHSRARLCKNKNYSQLRGNNEYLLDAYSPLNSINRKFAAVRIVSFWDEVVKEECKSKR